MKADPIKYEVGNRTDALFVDRFMRTTMNKRWHWHRPEDLQPERLAQIRHFFEHYKDLEPGQWVKVMGCLGPAEARTEIMDSVARYRAAKPKPMF